MNTEKPLAQGEQTLLFARQELEEYLLRITHAGERQGDFPIRMGIGFFSAFDDRYQIHMNADSIEITASNPRSVLLAVYRLLSELGCRFLGPGKKNELIPQLTLTGISIDITEQASFRHRGICIEGADSLDNILDFIDWLPKAGFNSFFLQHKNPKVFLELWYRHKFNPLPDEVILSDAQLAGACKKIDEAIALRSIIHHRVGHGWTSEAADFDVPCQKVPDSLLHQEQPILAMIDGKRSFYQGVPSNTNLCYSNSEAVKAFTDSVVSYAAGHPEVDYLHVWLADEYNNVCECDECRKTTLSDQYLHLLNHIDRELTLKNLSTKIVLLLYQELLWPPVSSRLRNPDRFVLMFAPISRTFESSYEYRKELPPVPAYVRNGIELPHSLEENLSFLHAWRERYPDLDSFDYDYPLGRAHYGDLGYVHIAKIIYEDIRTLQELRLNGYISCQELRAAFPNSLPNYVMGRMLWNREMDFEELCAEYFSAAYGSGWNAVLTYLQQISALSSCDYFNGIGGRTNKKAAAAFHQIAELAKKQQPLIRKQAQELTGIPLNYWHRLDYHATYCILLSEALAALAEHKTGLAQQLWLQFVDRIRRSEPDFQDCLDVYRVIEVATKYTGFQLDV